VLTVETKTITTRPSVPFAAWAPVSAPSCVPATTVFRDRADHQVAPTAVTAGAPQLPQAHQVRVQAELALAAVRASEIYGTNGSTVKGITMGAVKRLFAVARGVPPRGRPV
jgi:hypothetical protein